MVLQGVSIEIHGTTRCGIAQSSFFCFHLEEREWKVDSVCVASPEILSLVWIDLDETTSKEE